MLFLSLISHSQTAPPGVEILSTQLRGSGCDFNNVSVSLSPNGTDLSLLFDDYGVELGTASLQPNQMTQIKDCQIVLQVKIPEGWQMAFKAVDYRGYVNLPQSGASAFHRFSILQHGAPIVSMREAAITGPINDDYYVRAEIRPDRLTWSQCLRDQTQIILASQLGVRLNPRAAKPDLVQLLLDSSDVSLQQNLTVGWRPCHLGGGNGRPPVIRPPRFQPR